MRDLSKWICQRNPANCDGVHRSPKRHHGHQMPCPFAGRCVAAQLEYHYINDRNGFPALFLTEGDKKAHFTRGSALRYTFYPERARESKRLYDEKNRELVNSKQRARREKTRLPHPPLKEPPLPPCGRDCDNCDTPFDCQFGDEWEDRLQAEIEAEKKLTHHREENRRKRERAASDADYAEQLRVHACNASRRYYNRNIERLRAEARERKKRNKGR